MHGTSDFLYSTDCTCPSQVVPDTVGEQLASTEFGDVGGPRTRSTPTPHLIARFSTALPTPIAEFLSPGINPLSATTQSNQGSGSRLPLGLLFLITSPGVSRPPVPPAPEPIFRRSYPPQFDDLPLQEAEDLTSLYDAFLKSPWLARDQPEPRIGDPDCPPLAERYGQRGRSCFAVFVYQKPDLGYGCRHEGCFRDGGGGISFRSMGEAIRHQQRDHFNHSPTYSVQ